jgi:predicted Zn-dependent peptidase
MPRTSLRLVAASIALVLPLFGVLSSNDATAAGGGGGGGVGIATIPGATRPSGSAPAQTVPGELRPKLDLMRFTLANGLRVVLERDPSSPTVAVAVWYDVGSRNEKPGEGGFAHLFEHMMFEGTDKVPRGEHDKIVEGRGGKLNASTSEDWTRYWEMMPSSELAVTLFLEADRMKSLKVTEEAFENQRKVVQEEYRMRVENAPYVKGYFRLMELVYDGYHPYAHPAIGSMKELDEAKLEWVKRFHDTYYGPNGAVLAISGDVDFDAAQKLVHQYFDPIAPIALTPFTDATYGGRKGASPIETVTDAAARTPSTAMGWAIPKDGDDEHYALELAATILGDGESSRLEKKLVRELAWAQSVEIGTEDHRGPDAFMVDVRLSEKGKAEDVEKAVFAELEALAKTGPSAEEMKKARAKVEHAFLFGLQSNLSRALALAKYEGQRGDARLLTTDIDKYLAVTPEKVKAAVAKWLRRDKVAQVRVVPVAKAAPAASGSASASVKPAPKGGK